MTPDQLIARGRGHAALSEHDSKRLLAAYGVPVCRERLVEAAPAAAVAAARAIGYPVVLKACGPGLAHKTEAGLVELGLGDDDAVTAAAGRLAARLAGPVDGFLVQEMLAGRRELIVGLARDPQFGPCVTFGLGGIYAEALDDAVSRPLPLGRADAAAMLDEIRGAALLGPVRGLPAVDREALCDILLGLARLARDRPDIAAVDVNPLVVVGGRPVAADALVVLG